MATIAKGYDLDHAWRAVGDAYRGAGYYLAAAEAGEPGTWWSPGAERLGIARGRQVERVSGLQVTVPVTMADPAAGRSSWH